MKILVIGATGATGKIAVDKLLVQGHEVTAFVRATSKFDRKHSRLRVAQGDVRDAAALESALDGQDAVFSAFGPRSRRKDDLQEVFMRHLVDGMKRRGVRRLVNLSALGAGDSSAQAPWLFRAVIVPLFLKAVFTDKERGESILLASGLDYVNVRPGRLLNTPAKGGVKASLESTGLSPFMTREDLADFMIANLDNPQWLGKSPLIGY